MPIKVHCNGISKGAKLAWYTRHVEKITVDVFLETIASEIDKKYNL